VNENRLRLLSLGANLRRGGLTPLPSLSCLFDLLCFLIRVGGCVSTACGNGAGDEARFLVMTREQLLRYVHGELVSRTKSLKLIAGTEMFAPAPLRKPSGSKRSGSGQDSTAALAQKALETSVPASRTGTMERGSPRLQSPLA
jgi:hypothetical protein